MPLNRKTTEQELSYAVLRILSEIESGSATYAELIIKIPSYIELTDADKAPSETRENEQLWEQRVRNITSHKDSANNFIYLGYLESVDSGLRITDYGREQLVSIS